MTDNEKLGNLYEGIYSPEEPRHISNVRKSKSGRVLGKFDSLLEETVTKTLGLGNKDDRYGSIYISDVVRLKDGWQSQLTDPTLVKRIEDWLKDNELSEFRLADAPADIPPELLVRLGALENEPNLAYPRHVYTQTIRPELAPNGDMYDRGGSPTLESVYQKEIMESGPYGQPFSGVRRRPVDPDGSTRAYAELSEVIGKVERIKSYPLGQGISPTLDSALGYLNQALQEMTSYGGQG